MSAREEVIEREDTAEEESWEQDAGSREQGEGSSVKGAGSREQGEGCRVLPPRALPPLPLTNSIFAAYRLQGTNSDKRNISKT